jgi:hypothetical protein
VIYNISQQLMKYILVFGDSTAVQSPLSSSLQLQVAPAIELGTPVEGLKFLPNGNAMEIGILPQPRGLIGLYSSSGATVSLIHTSTSVKLLGKSFDRQKM